MRRQPPMALLTVVLAASFASGPVLSAQGTQTWWAYQPLATPAIPAVKDAAWARSPIDAFVLAKLEQQGLSPALPADPIAWLRRATYDLTGLPPTPAEIAAFVADASVDAEARVVDRLLASPQYGVRWGRHWLDLVRFAETDGYERDRTKPAAWRYRDWVIDAFNQDMPFDRFVTEQLAGDELDDPTFASLVATGYLRLGIWDDEPTDLLQAQYDDLDSITDTTGRVMLGMSIGCARCHDHKKDPIPTEDYYRLLAYFENLKPYKEHAGNDVTRANYVRLVAEDAEVRAHPARLQEWHRRRQAHVAELRELARTLGERLPGALQQVRTDANHGLVKHWDFNDGEGPPGHTGTALACSDERALRLPPPPQDLTVAFWFRAAQAGPGDNSRVWREGSAFVDLPGDPSDLGISLGNTRVIAGEADHEVSIVSAPGYADGAWHHAALTRDQSNGSLVLYLDGRVAGAIPGQKKPRRTPTEPAQPAPRQPPRGFVGELDEVRLYQRVLTAREVLELWLDEPGIGAIEEPLGRELGPQTAHRHRAAIEGLMAATPPQLHEHEVLCAQERGQVAPKSYVRRRGNANDRGPEVTPGIPTALGVASPPIEPGSKTTGQRLALARWLTSGASPLPARVLANRLWQYHFGRGIVRSPNDFGRLGDLPTHPELLDWLAAELMRQRWSLKAMHRLMMLSSAYSMASIGSDEALARDPQNDLFWRFDPRRLGAEEIRDSMLAVSGDLNLQLGGPSVYPKLPDEVLATASRPDAAWGESAPDQAARRSVYVFLKRSLLMPLLTAFDLADTDASCPTRFATIQPTQALTLLNGEFAHQQARALANRLTREAPDLETRLQLGFSLVTGRQPGDAQLAHGLDLFDRLQREHQLNATQSLQHVGLMLLNLNEFLFLD